MEFAYLSYANDCKSELGDVVKVMGRPELWTVEVIDVQNANVFVRMYDSKAEAMWVAIRLCTFIRRDLPPKAEELVKELDELTQGPCKVWRDDKSERAETRTHDTGAVRSTDADDVTYWCMPLLGLRRVAKTAKEGAVKYSPNNWKKGFKASVLYDHAMEHLVKWGAGDRGEDHIAHAAWNLLALADFQEQGRTDLMDCEPKGAS